jgi:hypothetical protein
MFSFWDSNGELSDRSERQLQLAELIQLFAFCLLFILPISDRSSTFFIFTFHPANGGTQEVNQKV